MKIPCKNIPTYDADNDIWITTSFNTQFDFGKFLLEECFKEPGEYEFDETTLKWNEHARNFQKNKIFTNLPEKTKDWVNFWEEEKLKCRLGVIYLHNGKKWYLTRDYYMLINFLPILNKEKGQQEEFCSVRDVQYHMMLYEKIAEIFHLHSVILKRRQCMFSCCHVAKTVNFLWFENKKTLKWFASDDSYLDDVNGSWKMLNSYKNFLNIHTGWKRTFTPSSYPQIQQKEEIKSKQTNKWITRGNESTVVAKTLKRDPTTGVGGPAFWIWHEEGGIAPKADITLQYLNPSLESGLEKVGSFCIGGSVGDLDACKPLEKFLEDPEKYQFLSVSTKWYDESGLEKQTGLFIPTQYGMPEATDQYGNSLPEKALDLLYKAENIGFKKGEDGRIQDEPAWKDLPHEEYILKKSQNPKTIKEAFAWRKINFFDPKPIERRQESLKILSQEGKFKNVKKGLLYEDSEGKPKLKPLSEFLDNDKPSEMKYPVDKKLVDKRGIVTIYEEPIVNPRTGEVDFDMYYGGVDSVDANITHTSDSLFSIHIIKRGIEIERITDKGEKILEYQGSKIVATYVGRFNNYIEHNEQGLLLMRLYKALSACERNRPNFINYVRSKGYSILIAKKKEMPFFKDIDLTGAQNDEYGIYMDTQGKTRQILNDNVKEYLLREIDVISKKDKNGNFLTDENGKLITYKTIRGIDLIDDYWLLEELKLWNEEVNADRLTSFSLALTMCMSREMSYKKKIVEDFRKPEEINKNIQKSPKNLLNSNYNPRGRGKNIKNIKSLLKY